jgi:methyl-accepting chemotaxis protein
MFKNMTIGKKLALGFAVVVLVLGGVVAMSFTGVVSIVTNAQDVIYGNSLGAEIAQKEVDHLNWVGKVHELLTDATITKLQVEVDDHKCGFGKWLYSDARKGAEKKIPALAPILKEIEEPHKHLHEYAVRIGENFCRADLNLSVALQQQKTDHLMWVLHVKDVFVDTSLTKADVQTDPHQCSFGKWFYSDEVKQMRSNDLEFESICAQIEEPHDKLHAGIEHINQLLAEGKRQDAVTYYMENTKPLADKTCDQIDKIIAWNGIRVVKMKKVNEIYTKEMIPTLRKVQDLLEKARDTVKDNIMTQDVMLNTAQATKRDVGIVGIIGILAGIILAFAIARGTTSVLRRVINNLTESSEQVSSASAQVSSASQSLAEGTTEQSAGLEDTSSSLEEMASMTRQNADNAGQANNLSGETRKAADSGNEAMSRMSVAINDIQKSSEETAKIIKVIDEIAFQTNLLALNAAVEAARAGEAGKGFAVVAEEVRNLAQRSAEAAKNTAAMIEESVKNAKNGVEISNEVASALEEIVVSVGKAADLVGEIAAASCGQAEGITQINAAMAQMDKVTQQNAANAEESASASEELSAQAEQMTEVVQELVAMVSGSNRHGNGSRKYRNINAAYAASKRGYSSSNAYHQNAGGKGNATKRTAAERAIPFHDDDDDNFDEFNA